MQKKKNLLTLVSGGVEMIGVVKGDGMRGEGPSFMVWDSWSQSWAQVGFILTGYARYHINLARMDWVSKGKLWQKPSRVLESP